MTRFLKLQKYFLVIIKVFYFRENQYHTATIITNLRTKILLPKELVWWNDGSAFLLFFTVHGCHDKHNFLYLNLNRRINLHTALCQVASIRIGNIIQTRSVYSVYKLAPYKRKAHLNITRHVQWFIYLLAMINKATKDHLLLTLISR